MSDMMRNLGFTLALPVVVALLGAPAVAQDADPTAQLGEGYAACLAGDDDVAKVSKLLTGHGWTSEPSGDEGLTYFTPATGKSVFAYMAKDGSFCHVESTSVNSAKASALLRKALHKAGFAKIEQDQDGLGCDRLNFDSGRIATIMSGGNDPTCTSDTDSGVRFQSAGADN